MSNPKISDDFGFGLGDLNPVKHAKTVGKAAVKATSKVASGTEKMARTAAKTAGKAAHSMQKTVSKVPVVGKPLALTVGLSHEPIKFAAEVAGGKRIDKAVLSSFKRQVKTSIALAPYAQLVAASIPGMGTGVAVAIAAGAALAEGRTINEAAVSAARAALPTPAARAAFDGAMAAAQGKDVTSSAIDAAVGAAARSQDERDRIKSAVEIAGSAARGKPLDKAALTAAIRHVDPGLRTEAEAKVGKPGAHTYAYDALTRSLPPEVKRALTSGLAVGFARERQRDIHSAITGSTARDKLTEEGKNAISKSGVLLQAQKSVPDPNSFALGIGLMRHSEVTPPAVLYLRDSLDKDRQRVSFDAATAIHIGAVTSVKLKGTDQRKVGYYAVIGSQEADPKTREAVVRLLTKSADGSAGAAAAIKQVRRRRSWWRRMLAWFGRRT